MPDGPDRACAAAGRMFRKLDSVKRWHLRGQGTVFVVVVIMAQNLSKNGRFWVDQDSGDSRSDRT
jgi:hypothetical protein